MAENTFLGLQSYTEADAYRFKGRTEESQELFRLIIRNDYTVCYAESGEGKTSLLNAGVFPLLRQNMFFPLAITFTNDDYQHPPDNFDTIIDRCIKDSIADYNEKNKGVGIEYKLCSTDFHNMDRQSALQQELGKYSWWKLRNYKLQAIGLTFTPVFVFDQFEEVFNLPGSIVWTKKFFDWLEEVSSDSCPDEIVQKIRSIIGDKAAFPVIKEVKDFKAVFSLRKEFIGELDYWGMQKCFIPSLKDNRYCLKALTYEGAKTVMLQQQRFAEDKVEQVLHYFVQQYSREPEKTIAENLPVIPALLLSVVCDSWEKDIHFFSDIDANGIDDSLNKILDKFYDEAISAIVNELSQQEINNKVGTIREDIETAIFALVDSNGKRVRRKSSELSHLDFDTKYKEILSDKRIIKISKVDGEDYVEIIHDSLCPIIAKRKEQRIAAEAKKREDEKLIEQTKKNLKRILLIVFFFVVTIGLITLFFWHKSLTEKIAIIEQQKKDLEMQYKHLKEQKNAIEVMNFPVGSTARYMEKGRPESILSNILTDILLWAGKSFNEDPDFAVYDIDGIRSALKEGETTYSDISSVAPFNNKICFVTLTGTKVMELFQEIAERMGEGVSHGVELVISSDGDLLSAHLNGEEINPNRKYRVATLTYDAHGGLSTFNDATDMVIPEGYEGIDRFLIMKYWLTQSSQGKAVDGKIEGRIVIK